MNADISVKIITDTSNNERNNAKDIEKSIGHSTISILTRSLVFAKKRRNKTSPNVICITLCFQKCS